MEKKIYYQIRQDGHLLCEASGDLNILCDIFYFVYLAGSGFSISQMEGDLDEMGKNFDGEVSWYCVKRFLKDDSNLCEIVGISSVLERFLDTFYRSGLGYPFKKKEVVK